MHQNLVNLLEAHYALDASDRGQSLLASLGFAEIGRGAWKAVYASETWPGIVVKRATDKHATCFNEVENAKTCPLHLLEYLEPILAHTKHFQVQRRIEYGPCPDDCPGEIEGMYDSDARNHTHDATGRLILVDYGQDRQWTDEYIREAA